MAIAPISSVSFRNNYNQVNFEGKKKEHKSSGMHIPSAVKAIPLATAIAMSPLTSVDASAQITCKADRIVQKHSVEDGWLPERFGLVRSEGEPCILVSEDINGDGVIDKLHLMRNDVTKLSSSNERGYIDGKLFEGVRVDTVGHYYDDLNKRELYYVIGPGFSRIYATRSDGKEGCIAEDYPHRKQFINKLLYDIFSGEGIPEQCDIVVKEGK